MTALASLLATARFKRVPLVVRVSAISRPPEP